MTDKITYSASELATLRDEVARRLSEKRFAHTLGVEEMAIRLGKIFLPDGIPQLRAAALLHDIAKEIRIDEQKKLVEKCHFFEEKIETVQEALHSFSGVAVILDEFPTYATDDILHAVMYHTLGDPAMNLFAEIIFLSDYIEQGRKYQSCIDVRNSLFDALQRAATRGECVKALHTATVASINNTMLSLYERGITLDERSLKTKIAFEALI